MILSPQQGVTLQAFDLPEHHFPPCWCPVHVLQATMDLVEDIAVQYMTDTVHAAMQAATARTAGTAR